MHARYMKACSFTVNASGMVFNQMKIFTFSGGKLYEDGSVGMRRTTECSELTTTPGAAAKQYTIVEGPPPFSLRRESSPKSRRPRSEGVLYGT